MSQSRQVQRPHDVPTTSVPAREPVVALVAARTVLGPPAAPDEPSPGAWETDGGRGDTPLPQEAGRGASDPGRPLAGGPTESSCPFGSA